MELINYDDLKKSCETNQIYLTKHLQQRCIERHINIKDIINTLEFGEIIEQYPDDYPYPSCLIKDTTANNEILHIVCGFNDGISYIITAYYPSDEKWNSQKNIRKD